MPYDGNLTDYATPTYPATWAKAEYSGGGEYITFISTGMKYGTGAMANAHSYGSAYVYSNLDANEIIQWTFDEDFTIRGWMKVITPSSGANHVIFTNQQSTNANTLIWFMQSDGTVNATHGTTNTVVRTAANSILDDGNWHFISLIRSNGVFTYYCDGSSTNTVSFTDSSTFVPSSSVRIGFGGGSSGIYGNTQWDDWEISKVAQNGFEVPTGPMHDNKESSSSSSSTSSIILSRSTFSSNSSSSSSRSSNSSSSTSSIILSRSSNSSSSSSSIIESHSSDSSSSSSSYSSSVSSLSIITVYGYLAGGSADGGSTGLNTVSKTNTDTDESTTIAEVISLARLGLAGYNSATDGYASGGYVSDVYRNNIDKTVFATDATGTIAATQSMQLGGRSGFNSTICGYACGGGEAKSSRCDKLTFSNDACASIGDLLTSAKAYPCGYNSSEAGYTCGGHDGSFLTTIDKTAFSNDATGAIVATNATALYIPAGINSANSGYTCGGSHGGGILIQKLLFSNESTSTIAATLAVSQTAATGFNTLTNGYVAGGHNAITTISKLLFSDETSSTAGAGLANGKATSAGFQSGGIL